MDPRDRDLPIRMLVVEDSMVYAQVLERLLKDAPSARLEVSWAQCLADGIDRLERGGVDVVLLDLALPDATGMKTVEQVLASAPDVPIVVLTGLDDEAVALEAVRCGAQDYLIKGHVDRDLLVRAVRYAIERKHAARALRESEERYAVAVRGARDGVWDWDLQSGKVYFSPRWKTILGCAEDEIGGTAEDWFRRIHPEDTKRVREMLDAHLEGRTHELEVEYRMVHKDGTPRWVLTRGLAVRDAAGKALRMAGSQTDVTERTAYFDALTGLPSLAMFRKSLSRALARAGRRKDYLCGVLALDMDRFQSLTDGLGHQKGDQVLVAIAHRLEKCLRPADVLARVEGDRFEVLLDDLRDVDEAAAAAERIHAALALPFEVEGEQMFLTAGIGIALANASYARPEELLRDADTAMKRAKAQGTGRTARFDVSMRERAAANLKLESDLRHALDRGEFFLNFQPTVSLASGHMTGAEVLVRWNHPERGLVPPNEFIALAEDTGLIVALGEWVLRAACDQNRAWRDAGRGCLSLAVNLSPRQFHERDFAERVRRVLGESGIPASALRLEITEGMAMKDVEFTIEILRQLRAVGVEISIDDFGTGHSSLNYLKRFPIQTLKVDRSFVRNLPADKDDGTIATAIIAMGHGLGLSVVAEGVETEAQRDFLRARGCDEMQGFLFSGPVSAAEIEKLWTRNARP